MTMKNRDKWITIAFLAFILTLPAVTLVRGFLPQAETSVSEEQNAVLDANGTMQDGNHGNDSTDTSQTTQETNQPWFTKVQNTLNDFTERLFTRTKLIALNTELTSLLTGGTYMESTQVLLGKDDWLFYKTQMDGHPVWDYMGINHFTEEELAAMAANLTQMRDYFENERGIDFYITALPNKEIVYEEYMPDIIARVNEVSRAEQVAEYIWANTDLTYIFPKQALLEAKEKYQIYYETDTHWNQIGAFVGMQEIFQEAYGTHANVDSVVFRVDSETFAGDLATIAGVSDKYANDTVYVFEKESADKTQYRDEVAFVVGDSFSGFLSTIAKGYYKEVHWIYTTEFTMDMVDELQPDVIIWETVERYMETFLNENLLTK